MIPEFDRKILTALIEAGGQLSCDQLKQLYTQKGDGVRHSTLIRRGLTEWVRPEFRPNGGAIAVRITDAGRAAIDGQREARSS